MCGEGVSIYVFVQFPLSLDSHELYNKLSILSIVNYDRGEG